MDPNLNCVQRPVPTLIRIGGIVTLVVTLLLLFVLGGFVTSFKVGMADPVWPTEPWYLLDKDWNKLEVGFLLEHTHRAAGWIVGLLVSVLALATWYTEPNRSLRFVGLLVMLGLLVSYGEFHRGMMAADELRKSGTPIDQVPWPVSKGYATLGMALLLLVCIAVSMKSNTFGKAARSLAALTLIGVMIQGLLGGFRVFLDQLFGTQLAAYHGVFAQLVLCCLTATVIYMAPRRDGDFLLTSERQSLSTLALLVPVVLVVQLVWAVWVRHLASPLAQRLHILTAFLATGLMIWLAVQALRTPNSRKQLGFLIWHMIGILVIQLTLGVEAYLAKFAAVGPQYNVLPLDRAPHIMDSTLRTLHSVIGASLLACSVVIAIRVIRRPLQTLPPTRSEAETRRIEVRQPVEVA